MTRGVQYLFFSERETAAPVLRQTSTNESRFTCSPNNPTISAPFPGASSLGSAPPLPVLISACRGCCASIIAAGKKTKLLTKTSVPKQSRHLFQIFRSPAQSPPERLVIYALAWQRMRASWSLRDPSWISLGCVAGGSDASTYI